MGHYRLKTKYNTEGDFGAIEENELFAHHNLSCDYVNFYDGEGNFIMSIPDTLDNNLLDAINRLYSPFENDKLVDGVDYVTPQEFEKYGL